MDDRYDDTIDESRWLAPLVAALLLGLLFGALLTYGGIRARALGPAPETPTLPVTPTIPNPTPPTVEIPIPTALPTETAIPPATATAVPTATGAPIQPPAPTATAPSNGGAQPLPDPLARVTVAALNVRAGPGTAYEIIRTLREGARPLVLGQDAQGGWLYVRMDDGTLGWISRSYTDYGASAPIVAAPPLPTAVPATATLVPTPLPPTPTPTPLPPTPTVVPTIEAPIYFSGWKGEYSEGINGSRLLVRDDAAIDFDWGPGSPAPGLPADHFSARWSRMLPFEPGRYRFELTMDDGARLTVDGQRLIDGWADGPSRTLTADVTLDGGNHFLVVEYFERTGAARVRLTWSRLPDSFSGWKGEYYNNPQLSGVPFRLRDDSALDFNWGAGAPMAGLYPDHFSVRWSRTQRFEAGRYRFDLAVDDGARLTIDGQRVIDSWSPGPLRTLSAEVVLDAGPHTIVVEYFEETGGAQLRLGWSRLAETFTGWKAEYFPNPTLSGTPRVVRDEPKLDFDWGSGAPAAELPTDGFSARFSRTIATDGGRHRVSLEVDDGARLWIDGQLVIDGWQDGPRRQLSAELRLEPGSHLFQVDYYERGGGASVRLDWERVGPLSTEDIR